jgi:acyl transferase domain-containing protein
MDDIAVIGIGLRFPGDATSPEELWEVLQTGQSQWSEFPKDRLNIDGYYHPGGDRQGSVSSQPFGPSHIPLTELTMHEDLLQRSSFPQG